MAKCPTIQEEEKKATDDGYCGGKFKKKTKKVMPFH
jgi:hypothetical protein